MSADRRKKHLEGRKNGCALLLNERPASFHPSAGRGRSAGKDFFWNLIFQCN